MQFETNEKSIKNDIANGITRSMNATFAKSSSGNPQEPDFVAELVNGIPQDIYNSLRAYAPHYRYAVSGIFCHQKPWANYGKRTELGDILLVYIEENKYSVKKCNALLLQVKKSNKVPYIVPASEEHQLKLYEEWPEFTLEHAGIWTGKKIDIQPKTLHTGAQYLLLQKPYKSEKKVCCAYPDKKLMPEKRLSEQIIDLMKFFTGRTFLYEQDSSCNDEWTKLIWYLMEVSRASVYNRKLIRRVGEPRIITHGDSSLLAEMDRRFEMIDNVIGEEGISSIVIYAKEVMQQEEE